MGRCVVKKYYSKKIHIHYQLVYKINDCYEFITDCGCEGVIPEELSYIRKCSQKKYKNNFQDFLKKIFIIDIILILL